MDNIKDLLTIIVPVILAIAGYIGHLHRRINLLFSKKANRDELRQEIEEMKDFVERSHVPNSVRQQKAQEDIKEMKIKQDKIYDMLIAILKKVS